MENYLKIYQNKEEYDQEGKKPILGHIINDIELVGPPLLLNAKNFPDANFRAALVEILGISEGDEITDEMIQQTTSLNVLSKAIANLKGVEHFTALTRLWCNNNQLTSLDVSKNTALEVLDCADNKLTSLDISNAPEIIYIYMKTMTVMGHAFVMMVSVIFASTTAFKSLLRC